MNLSSAPLTRSQVANNNNNNNNSSSSSSEPPKKVEVVQTAAKAEIDVDGEDDDEVTQEEDEEADAQDDDLDDDDEVDNFTTSEIVTVYVGPKRKRFFLHRELICERSPFMEKCLKKGHFDEGYKNELYLPEDDPKAFSIIVDWIYRSRIPLRTDPLFDVSDMSAAYCMADKFVMEELQNSIMDGIRASLSRKEGELCKTPYFSALALTHISGPPKSPLKRFLVEHMVHHMMKHPRWYHDLKRNEPSRVDVEDLFKIPDLVFYIMKKIWQFQAEPWKDPATWDKCCYHVHATTVCQTKVPPVPAKPILKQGVGLGPSSSLHGHNMRPGHGPWPGSALGNVWNPGVGW